MSQENIPNPEERKLEPYHYEAMIRAEVEKRMAIEKERTSSQNIVPRDFPEPQSQPLAYPTNSGWPVPGQQVQPGQYPLAQPQPGPTQPQPPQYYSGQLPAYQQPQPQPQPPAYYQPQPMPQPYYAPPPQPPGQPVINVVVQNSSVNQNVNRNYVGRGYGHVHGHIGCFNVCYFLIIGWALGLTVAMAGLCVLPFSRSAGDDIMRMAFFLAFLV